MIRWFVVSGIVTAIPVGLTAWLVWEARRTERCIAAAFNQGLHQGPHG